ncbi:MAG: carbamate kinase, partial [Rhodospirillaceae bacterium]|nr:carbamate kinase [Rhodospirillaceae bacterium]
SAAAQRESLDRAAQALAPLAGGNELIVTHGNGPQIGLLAQAQSGTRSRGRSAGGSGLADLRLDELGAETVGLIGYLLEQALARRAVRAATLLTQVVVDPADPAFADPSKPIGPVYGEAEAEALAAARGWEVRPDGAGWRRVVPSPAPLRILEITAIRALLDAGLAVICAGGGGMPVVETGGGGYLGVEAVIDKDATSALLAGELGADALLLLTDVDAVYEGWGTQEAKPIREAAVSTLLGRSFAAGSMAPKVAAACAFVAATGRHAAIGAMEDAAALLSGETGTRILPDRSLSG